MIFQASLVLRRNAKRESSSVLVKKRNQSETNRLVQLLAGSNTEARSVDDVAMGDWEPFYGAMYLSLEGVSSDNMQAKVTGNDLSGLQIRCIFLCLKCLFLHKILYSTTC